MVSDDIFLYFRIFIGKCFKNYVKYNYGEVQEIKLISIKQAFDSGAKFFSRPLPSNNNNNSNKIKRTTITTKNAAFLKYQCLILKFNLTALFFSLK